MVQQKLTSHHNMSLLFSSSMLLTRLLLFYCKLSLSIFIKTCWNNINHHWCNSFPLNFEYTTWHITEFFTYSFCQKSYQPTEFSSFVHTRGRKKLLCIWQWHNKKFLLIILSVATTSELQQTISTLEALKACNLQ